MVQAVRDRVERHGEACGNFGDDRLIGVGNGWIAAKNVFFKVAHAIAIGIAARPICTGGVGAVEAALIGGLAAFGVPAAVAVPSVLLYRVLTTWIPVFVGWPVMRWMTRNDLI